MLLFYCIPLFQKLLLDREHSFETSGFLCYKQNTERDIAKYLFFECQKKSKKIVHAYRFFIYFRLMAFKKNSLS